LLAGLLAWAQTVGRVVVAQTLAFQLLINTDDTARNKKLLGSN